jgi:hypothetical protein
MKREMGPGGVVLCCVFRSKWRFNRHSHFNVHSLPTLSAAPLRSSPSSRVRVHQMSRIQFIPPILRYFADTSMILHIATVSIKDITPPGRGFGAREKCVRHETEVCKVIRPYPDLPSSCRARLTVALNSRASSLDSQVPPSPGLKRDSKHA